jgi:hypothetical protein
MRARKKESVRMAFAMRRTYTAGKFVGSLRGEQFDIAALLRAHGLPQPVFDRWIQ